MYLKPNGDLVILKRWSYDHQQMVEDYLPAKHVQMIRNNLECGMSWVTASPVYCIERKWAAFIYCNVKPTVTGSYVQRLASQTFIKDLSQ